MKYFVVFAFAILIFSSNSGAVDFSGKRIEIIVPAGAGGGLTRNARAWAKHFGNHVPGKPTVVVKNITGGGGQKGINFVYTKGKKDGTQIIYGPMNFVGINVGLPGIKYLPKKFKILGLAGGTPFITIVRSDIKGGIKNREEIMTKSGFVTGGRIPGGNLGLFSRMPFAILGIKNRFVVGYKNQPKLKAAMIQNEIQALTTGNPGFFAFYLNDTLKKGKGVALFTHPSIDIQTGQARAVTHIKGVPTFLEFYSRVKGGKPSGDAWEAYSWKARYDIFPFSMFMHPDTPDDITKTLQKAWLENWNDPATVALYKKGNKTVPVLLQGNAADAIINNFRNMSAGAKRYFASELGVAKKSRKKKKK